MIVKRGDKYPTTWTVNTDLSGADSTRLLAKSKADPDAPVIELAHTVTDAVNGVVTHELDGTLEVGGYRVELEITKGDEIVTAPSSSFAELKVIADLG